MKKCLHDLNIIYEKMLTMPHKTTKLYPAVQMGNESSHL